MDLSSIPPSPLLVKLPYFNNPPSDFPNQFDLNEIDSFTQTSFNTLFQNARNENLPAYYIGLAISARAGSRKYTFYDGVHLTKYIFEKCKARGQVLSSKEKVSVLANLHLYQVPSLLDRAPIAKVCWLALPCKEIPLQRAVNLNLKDPRFQLLTSDVLNVELKNDQRARIINLLILGKILGESRTCMILKEPILNLADSLSGELGDTEPELIGLLRQSPAQAPISTPIIKSPFNYIRNVNECE